MNTATRCFDAGSHTEAAAPTTEVGSGIHFVMNELEIRVRAAVRNRIDARYGFEFLKSTTSPAGMSLAMTADKPQALISIIRPIAGFFPLAGRSHE